MEQTNKLQVSVYTTAVHKVKHYNLSKKFKFQPKKINVGYIFFFGPILFSTELSWSQIYRAKMSSAEVVALKCQSSKIFI